jgi:hypothetical protein
MIRAAVMIRRVAMARENHFRPELGGPGSSRLKIIYFKPEEHAVTRCDIWIADGPVMMRHIPAMQLKDQAVR